LPIGGEIQRGNCLTIGVARTGRETIWFDSDTKSGARFYRIFARSKASAAANSSTAVGSGERGTAPRRTTAAALRERSPVTKASAHAKW
jgi:hypothetical protein